MNLTIEKASEKYLDDCEIALSRSTLGEKYFSKEGSARQAVIEGLDQGTMYVALCDDECAGFYYLIPKGAFHGFPYLHIIAVKEEYRSRGIGGALMKHMEEQAFEYGNKVFLVVADFNPDGKRFYERIGYRQVGVLPSLYRPGITEYLMMKEKA